MMTARFEVAARVNRPVGEVFEAVVDPGSLSQYFTTGEPRAGWRPLPP